MTFKIPNIIFGKPVDGALERMLARSNASQVPTAPANESLPSTPIAANINPADYIQVPQKKLVIAKRQDYNGLKFEEAIRATADKGLRVPRIDEMVQHFINVRDAVEGRMTLHDGNNNAILQAEAREHWNYLSSTDRSKFGNTVFWTWLDAFFKENASGLYIMETDHRVVKDASGATRINSRNMSLDAYVKMNGWTGLSFNNQGLPVSASPLSQYTQGQNIYFYQPVKDRVARFYAYSGGAGLYCDGGPRGSSSVLGVLACAEGTSRARN